MTDMDIIDINDTIILGRKILRAGTRRDMTVEIVIVSDPAALRLSCTLRGARVRDVIIVSIVTTVTIVTIATIIIVMREIEAISTIIEIIHTMTQDTSRDSHTLESTQVQLTGRQQTNMVKGKDIMRAHHTQRVTPNHIQSLIPSHILTVILEATAAVGNTRQDMAKKGKLHKIPSCSIEADQEVSLKKAKPKMTSKETGKKRVIHRRRNLTKILFNPVLAHTRKASFSAQNEVQRNNLPRSHQKRKRIEVQRKVRNHPLLLRRTRNRKPLLMSPCLKNETQNEIKPAQLTR